MNFFTKMWFLVFCIYISLMKSNASYNHKTEDLDISRCNYGKYADHNFGSICNCSRVIGNGPSCNVNITFNNTHYYMTELCLLDDSILWKKNLEVLNEHVNITGKDENVITGIINEKTYIKVMNFCEKAYKKVYPVLRPTKKTMNIDDFWKSFDYKIGKMKKDIINEINLSYYCAILVIFIFVILIYFSKKYMKDICIFLIRLRTATTANTESTNHNATATTANTESTNLNAAEDEKSIPIDRNPDSGTQIELITFLETDQNSPDNVDSCQESRGSPLQVEDGSTNPENEDADDPLLQNQKNCEIPTENKKREN